MLIAGILVRENIEIFSVDLRDIEAALKVAQCYGISVNDAIAYAKMREAGIEEAYTFDKHFHNLPVIKAFPQLPE